MIALAAVAGIWLASQFPLPAWLPAFVLILGLFTAIGAWRWGASSETIWLCAFVSLSAFGALRYNLSAPVPAENSVARFNGQRIALEGVVVEEPDVRAAFINLRVQPGRVLGAARPDEPLEDIVLVRFENVAGVAGWRYGDVVRVSGLLDAPPRMSTFDYRDYLARRGVFSWITRPDALIRIDTGRGDWLYTRLLEAKDAVRQTVRRILPMPESALLNGILIGDDNAIPEDLKQAFRRTGTSHIVAISGYNVGIVVVLTFAFLRRIMNRRRAALLLLPTLALYTIFVGAPASVVRASIMAGIGLIGIALGRKGFTLNTLCAAAFFMLVADPNTLFDVGFQLSFLATLGLVLYANRLSNPVRQWTRPRFKNDLAQNGAMLLLDGALITFAAQIMTVPLILSVFQELSLTALLTNLLVLPLQPPIMTLGGTASFVGMFASRSVGEIIALPARWFLSTTIGIVEGTSQFKFAAVPVYDFGTAAALIYYALLLTVTLIALQPIATRRAIAGLFRTRMGTVVILCGATVMVVWGGLFWFQRPDGRLHITFVGSSAIIQTPTGKQMIFAGSGDVASILGRMMPIGDREIELLVLPQRSDRLLNDLSPVMQRYRVATIIAPSGPARPNDRLAEWVQAASNATRVITVPFNTAYDLDPELTLMVEGRAPGRDGSQTIGVRLVHGANKIDLIGDSAPIAFAPDQDLIFVKPGPAQMNGLNEAEPGWVVWTDTPGVPARVQGLQRTIRAISLKAIGQITGVSDGEKLVFR